MTAPLEVRVTYPFSGSFAMDDACHAAAGRESDFSGAGMGYRDLGWLCESEVEAHRIRTALKKIGLAAEIRP